ncbi:MAG: TetR/AcrR family transcriptional regulator [Chloroflexi bacterium]|nr:TetR/AcrR family transcriptional regulator [Chloroflexota bacterium]
MTQTRRERLREVARTAVRDEIKAAAHRLMKTEGAAAVSLRAIARDLGMTAPALYRYYGSRDDLITALIVDAYTSQADWLQQACDMLAPDDHAGRLLMFGLVYREWSLAHPEDFALLYGTPIPGYHAPWEVTAPAAQRNMSIVLKLLDAAWQAGAITLAETYTRVPATFRRKLAEAAAAAGYDVPFSLLHFAMVAWGHLQGLISLELFGHLVLLGEQAGEVYRLEAEALVKCVGLKPSQRTYAILREFLQQQLRTGPVLN